MLPVLHAACLKVLVFFYVCFYLKVRLNITPLSITHTVVIIVIIIILSTCYCICTESSCHRTVSNGFSSNCAPYNWKHCHSIMQGQSVQVFIWLQFLQQSQNKAPWEILSAAQIIPWSTGHSEFAEKETQLGHFANFLNLGCVTHWSTKAVLSSSLTSHVCCERQTINSMLSCISPTQLQCDGRCLARTWYCWNKWMCSLADKREWILFRTSHVIAHTDDDSFLVYFHAFAVSAFKCLCFVIQQVRIYGTTVGIKDVCWCYLDTRCDWFFSFQSSDN